MGRWSRGELEAAFENFQRVLGEAGASGDWSKWAELYSDDVTYVEHQFGTFQGRDAEAAESEARVERIRTKHAREKPAE